VWGERETQRKRRTESRGRKKTKEKGREGNGLVEGVEEKDKGNREENKKKQSEWQKNIVRGRII
jgi:hypothetical protein